MIRENEKERIEEVRKWIINRRKFMNEFKQDIWERARIKFGEISEEVEQRLTVETNAIMKYRRCEMLRTMSHLVDELKNHGINISLNLGQGYNVSLVCYLLGISTFNPMDHPVLNTEQYAISAFGEIKQASEIIFKIDKDRPEIIDRFLHSLKYEIERTDVPETYLHSWRIKAINDGNSDFTLEFKYVPNVGRIRIAGELIGWKEFEKIPTDDIETMKLIHDINIYGTTTSSLDPITIEAIREIKPSNTGELADAMSFTSERKYSHLLKYLENKETGNKVYTGYQKIDEILFPTHGIILNTWQKGQILKMRLRRELGETGYHTIRKKYRSLMASPLLTKCDIYVKSYNLYRLAYVKVHYPEVFGQLMGYSTNH